MTSDLGLALLSSPTTVKIDVVFLHGLGGSRSTTWTNKDNVLWLTWVGDSVPGARIWTYGYNSSFWKAPSEDALELHCATLLEACATNHVGKEGSGVIFVCHSLGGILFKSVWSTLCSRCISIDWKISL